MKAILISAILSLSVIVPAAADAIDDAVIKAQASVERAEKKLAKAIECQNDKPACIAVQRETLTNTIARAQEKLTALSN